MRSKLTMLCLLGFLTAPGWTFAQPVTKVDSLRWAMMQWEKTGNAEMAALVDSLRLCITAEQDDGSGVIVDVGDSEGLSVTPLYETENTFVPGRGFTHVWEGRNEGSSERIDIVQLDVVETKDPRDDVGPGVGLGISFPTLDIETLRIVVTNGDEVVIDTTIADPGPGTPPPGPFPLPDLPEILWIDWEGGSDFPDFTWCEKTDLEKAEESDILGLGPDVRRAGATPVLGFSYQLIKPRDIWIMGAERPAYGDRVAIVPQGQTLVPDYITGMTIIPRQLSEVTILEASLHKYGLEHFPNRQSEALVTALLDSLLWSDIGDSGLDGVRTVLPEGTAGVWTDMRPLSLRSGESLDWSLGGTINAAVLDSMWRFSTIQVGTKTFFELEADPATGWTDFNLQFVRNGNILRERTVPNGFRLGVTGMTLDGFGMATLANQGWDGFLIAVLRNGAEGEIRVVPKGADNFADIRLTEVRLDAASPFEDMEVAYEEIKWTVIGAVAPRALAETPARPASPVSGVAEAPRLQGNYPEPFNPVTTIRYALPEAAHVRLEVFDLTGRRVAVLVDGERPAGQYTARFDASRLASGMYLYRLRAGATVQSKTMMLMK